MKKEDREHFDELITRAVQSGKRETSGLVVEFKKSVERVGDSLIEHTKNDDERFSALESGISELKSILKIQNEDMVPVIIAFRDNKVALSYVGDKLSIVFKGATGVAVLYGAWEIINNIFKLK